MMVLAVLLSDSEVIIGDPWSDGTLWSDGTGLVDDDAELLAAKISQGFPATRATLVNGERS